VRGGVGCIPTLYRAAAGVHDPAGRRVVVHRGDADGLRGVPQPQGHHQEEVRPGAAPAPGPMLCGARARSASEASMLCALIGHSVRVRHPKPVRTWRGQAARACCPALPSTSHALRRALAGGRAELGSAATRARLPGPLPSTAALNPDGKRARGPGRDQRGRRGRLCAQHQLDHRGPGPHRGGHCGAPRRAGRPCSCRRVTRAVVSRWQQQPALRRARSSQ
jgi:hypothetical protein